jgi:hypothetical protein
MGVATLEASAAAAHFAAGLAEASTMPADFTPAAVVEGSTVAVLGSTGDLAAATAEADTANPE